MLKNHICPTLDQGLWLLYKQFQQENCESRNANNFTGCLLTFKYVSGFHWVTFYHQVMSLIRYLGIIHITEKDAQESNKSIKWDKEKTEGRYNFCDVTHNLRSGAGVH